MSTGHYDAIVIGTGPGGEGAAMKLAKAGKDVAVIERYESLGGGCTHWGTIPSKTLRHAVQRVADSRADPLFRRLTGPVSIDYGSLLKAAESVIGRQTAMREGFYHRNHVEVVPGFARFVDAHTVEVQGASGAARRYQAEHFVVASGSHPYHPEDVDFDHPRVHDSDSILEPLGFSPRSIAIYGAGVIGCEYASIFANLGLKVNLINTRDQLLAFLDDEITTPSSWGSTRSCSSSWRMITPWSRR